MLNTGVFFNRTTKVGFIFLINDLDIDLISNKMYEIIIFFYLYPLVLQVVPPPNPPLNVEIWIESLKKETE